jgi:ribosome-associated protein
MIVNDCLVINDAVAIPLCELVFITSRSGGPGGQHVNKTDSRVTVRWNVPASAALTDDQKQRLLSKLASKLTNDGDLVMHSSTSRSQGQNKEAALQQLAHEIAKGLVVPKKRVATKPSKAKKAERVDAKKHRGVVKKLRNSKIERE